VFIVPLRWLGEGCEWKRVNRLDCYGCGAKIGCWGQASCGCGAKGVSGVLVNLSRVDKSGS
jgi:hypothetical protein